MPSSKKLKSPESAILHHFLVLIQPNCSIALDELQIDLVTQQLSDVPGIPVSGWELHKRMQGYLRDAVLDHGRPFQGQTEAVNTHVLGQTHGLQHLGSEHAAVADLRFTLDWSFFLRRT